MPTNTLTAPTLTLGGFLRDRRERLSPEPSVQGRRRTPGLRREEVATRAGVSVTWYTWLEQERGGPPSSEVLERLARALELDNSGRKALFLLAQQRPPPLRSAPIPAVTPALQRVLDGFATSAAIVKTPTWDVVAWNAAAVARCWATTRGYRLEERNVLRRLFDPENPRRAHVDWEHDARFAIAVFRMDVARAGDSTAAAALATEMQASSADFRQLWAENGISNHWVGRKRFENPLVGAFSLETSAFAVGADGLSMIVFSPVAAADLRAVELWAAEKQARSAAPSLKATA